LGKILVVLDYFTESLLGFAAMIFPKREEQQYIGISLSTIGATSLKDFTSTGADSYIILNEKIYEMEEDEGDLVTSFRWAARKFKVPYNIHINTKSPCSKVLEETTYADLIIISSTFSYNHYLAEDFTILLKCSQCPVMIVPAPGVNVENIIIPIDEHVSSIGSLKMFSYLMSEFLAAKKVTILAKKPITEAEMEKEGYLIELLTNHFVNPGFQWLLTDDPGSEVIEYMSTVSNPLLVLGNNREQNKGSLFSYNDLSKMQTIPIFIGD
jgi:hypothetical protein